MRVADGIQLFCHDNNIVLAPTLTYRNRTFLLQLANERNDNQYDDSDLYVTDLICISSQLHC